MVRGYYPFMLKIILIIFLSFITLNATDDSWINPSKKVILLDYAQDIEEAKVIAKDYKNHDVYIYNTIQNSNACCAIHIVNIDKSKVKTLLKKVKQVNSSAKELSKTRVRYFAKDLSPKNLFIESNSTIQEEIVPQQSKTIQKKQIIQNISAQDTDNNWINPKKKAILVEYVQNPKEADEVAKKYINQDIYIHSTVKNQNACCAVYIVNIKNKDLPTILKKVSKTTKDAKKVSNAKIKYFASDLSPKNKFIGATAKTIAPKQEIVIKEIIKKPQPIVVKKITKQQKDKAKVKEIIKIQKITIKKKISIEKKEIIVKPKKEIAVSQLAKNYIDKTKKIITIASFLNLKNAKNGVKRFQEYDMYIYKTINTRISYFVVYAVNIDKENRSTALKKIKRRFRDAYASSNVRIKTLASSDITNNIFIKSTNSSRTISKPIVKIAKIKKPIIKKLVVQKPKEPIIKKEDKTLAITTNIINSTKKIITIARSNTLSRAKRLAKKLSKYNLYIYKTLSTKRPYYMLYAVNIEKSNRKQAIKDIRMIFKDAYASSTKQIKYLSSTNINNNIFIPASTN